jgi:hypothetical protein
MFLPPGQRANRPTRRERGLPRRVPRIYARRVVWRAPLLAVAFAVASSALAPPAGAVTSAQIVQTINAERAANGLPPVREDPALSAGCAQYNSYRRMNGSVDDAFTLGREDPAKPGYTAAGARASRDSLLNAGDRAADSFANGDVFDDAPNHLVALMDPGVAVVGADQLDFDVGSFFGTASLSCVDVRSAPQRRRPRRMRVYSYVGPGGRAPTDPSYREGPPGAGPFIFLYFFAPRKARVTLTSLKVRRGDGSVGNPDYVALNGGLIDGRRRSAHKANVVGEGFDPNVAIRWKFRMVKEFEDLAKYEAEVSFGVKTYEETGQIPVPHD